MLGTNIPESKPRCARSSPQLKPSLKQAAPVLPPESIGRPDHLETFIGELQGSFTLRVNGNAPGQPLRVQRVRWTLAKVPRTIMDTHDQLRLKSPVTAR